MKKLAYLLFFSSFLFACHVDAKKSDEKEIPVTAVQNDNPKLDVITFGAGCFWCVEAVFEELKGVEKVVSGYSGGHVDKPSYRAVCNGTTGHAEVTQVFYDPKEISLEELFEVFFKTHDPTTLNRQGNDVGTQYRSVIFYHDEAQKKVAEQIKAELNLAEVFPNPIVTEISMFKNFYKAENYHQDYYELNGSQPYCRYVIRPKMDKLHKLFADKLKK